MKYIKYNYPKSSFLNVEKDLGIIIDKILQNERLQKLLYWNHKDALTRRKLTEEEKYSLLGKQIKLTPKVYVDPEMLVYLVISFGNFAPNATNPEFRDNTIHFDIICHFDQWLLDDMQLRPYKIAAELDSMFNESKLTGIGKLHFVNGDQVAISGEEYAGVSLMYLAVHGEDDKINAPAVPSNADLEENFDKLFNPHKFESIEEESKKVEKEENDE